MACLRERKQLWGASGITLPAEYRLPNFGELEQARTFADVRGAWSGEGLAFTAEVTGKRHPVWCRDTRLEDSDSLQLWIDTRDTHNIHRASRFCHRFVFMPAGGGRGHAEPIAEQLLINRARENAPPVPPKLLKVRAELRKDGYRLEAFLPAKTLAGFSPSDHPRLGFTYAVYDRELGLQTFSVGTGYPFDEDPSTWGTLEMVAS